MVSLTEWEAIQRIALALVAGAIIGLEREWADKPAGLRTYALVCEGAALFMIGSLMLGDQVRASGGIAYDPSRIGSTIVQGIGFLAGGVILTAHGKIRGLTTAAGIWVTAALGLLIGAGFYIVASVGTVATLIVLWVFRWIEGKIPHPVGNGSEVGAEEDF